LRNIKNLVEDSVVLENLALTKNLRLVDTLNPEAQEFEDAFRQYKKINDTYHEYVEANKNWRQKLQETELEQAIEMAKKFEKSFFAFLNGGWRKLKRQMASSYDFSSHAIKPVYSLLLKQLQS
jgi:hypothetical protein